MPAFAEPPRRSGSSASRRESVARGRSRRRPRTAGSSRRRAGTRPSRRARSRRPAGRGPSPRAARGPRARPSAPGRPRRRVAVGRAGLRALALAREDHAVRDAELARQLPQALLLAPVPAADQLEWGLRRQVRAGPRPRCRCPCAGRAAPRRAASRPTRAPARDRGSRDGSRVRHGGAASGQAEAERLPARELAARTRIAAPAKSTLAGMPTTSSASGRTARAGRGTVQPGSAQRP